MRVWNARTKVRDTRGVDIFFVVGAEVVKIKSEFDAVYFN